MGFTRTRENFVCERCGTQVRGDGYTNHCPECLWSKHVDIEPGDRAADFGGLMKPERVLGSSPHYAIQHCCERCGFRRINSVRSADSPEAIVALARGSS